MKKILVTVVAAMMAVTSVNAQNGYDDTKHEVAVTYGVGSTSQWLDVYEEMGTIIFGASYSDSEFTGPYSVEYFYHMKNWLGVGGIFAYGKDTQDMLISNRVVGQNYHRYYTLMPAVKFDWLRTRNFGLYSKLGIGATLRHESFKRDDSSVKDDSSSDLHVNWQLSLLGVEAGLPNVRAFFELGFGEQGILNAGLRYKF